MFLPISCLYVCSIKLQRRIVFFIAFIGEASFYNLLIFIRIERHFPMEISLTYFGDVRDRVESLNYFYQSLLKAKMCHLQKCYTLRLICPVADH